MPEAATVYLFSDGVFEIVSGSGVSWRLGDFLPVILADHQPGLAEPQRLYETMRVATRNDTFDDDFSLVVLTLK